MTEQYQEFVDAGVEIIAVAPDMVENARSYVEEHYIPFPCLVDPGHEIYDRYQVESKALSLGQRPGLFIVDTEGITQFAYIGRQQWEIPRNDDVLEKCRGIPCGITT